MNQTCENARDFLAELMSDMRFDLDISADWTDEGKACRVRELNIQVRGQHLFCSQSVTSGVLRFIINKPRV